MTNLVEELKQMIIDELKLEAVTPQQIDPAAPLFGQGLGLNSIDALELVVVLEERYGIRITNIEVGKRAFESVNALAEFVERIRQP